MNMYYVYILYNKEIDKYYTGQTKDLASRLKDHNIKGHKVKFTKKYEGLWEIKYKEKFDTRSEAVKREKYIKSRKSREFIENLILTMCP
jgi:putative endonuclease